HARRQTLGRLPLPTRCMTPESKGLPASAPCSPCRPVSPARHRIAARQCLPVSPPFRIPPVARRSGSLLRNESLRRPAASQLALGKRRRLPPLAARTPPLPRTGPALEFACPVPHHLALTFRAPGTHPISAPFAALRLTAPPARSRSASRRPAVPG